MPDTLLGDPLRLGQIILNLVGNAVKFTEYGQVMMVVRNLGRTGDKIQLQVHVHDTGIGMTPEQAGRLFQPLPKPIARPPGNMAALVWALPSPSASSN